MKIVRSSLLFIAGIATGVGAVFGGGATVPALNDVTVFTRSLGSISGLAFDGQALWVTLDGRPIIHRIDARSGRIMGSIAFATGDTGGSAWDGRTLWQLAYRERAIYRVDVKSGHYQRAFESPGEGMCSGMTFDGRYLWVANFDAGKLFQIDQREGGRIVRTIGGHVETTGLAWDGHYLWSGVLLGVKEHDAATPYTGFVQQQDPTTEETLRAVPVAGVGPGTSDWVPGRAGASRFWWYDGFHNRVIVLANNLPRRWWPLRFTWRAS